MSTLAHARLVQTESDAAKATRTPGLYVAISGSRAYTLLRAMAAAGLANQVGDRAYDKHRVVGTFRVGKPTAVRPNPAITIGREFFISALKDYQEWPVKWWREVIQNAVDAHATRVSLEAKQNPDGTWIVACEDNGGGMSEDVLLNRFLVLGGTTKTTESGSAGGFGKAKELILLPWISWKIHTQDRIVSGAGADYQVSEATMLRGTRVEVVMPVDQHTTESSAIEFLARSYLPDVRFTVNDKPVSASLKPKKQVGEIAGKAEIFFNKDSEKGVARQMLIRAKGLYMFSMWLGEGPEGDVIVELTAPSIEILTANRDGLRDYTVRREIDQLVQRIAKDIRSALKGGKLLREKFRGHGMFRAKNLASDAIMATGPISIPQRVASIQLPQTAIDRLQEMVSDVRSADRVPEEISEDSGSAIRIIRSVPSAEQTAEVLRSLRITGARHLEAAVQQLVWQPDFFLINEIEDFRVPAKFKPKTMTPTVLKLVKVWTELCRYVLMQLGSSETFGVGLVFSDSAGANYVYEDDENWLLLNPYRGGKQDKLLSPSKEPDLKWMYAAAIHEATHMADNVRYHDEAFSSAFTRNVALCADGYRHIKRIAASIRMRGGMEADA